jgi:DNA polymerase III alpha subunit (gram-positive type)
MTETFISVDIECTGLIVGEDNLASIGACNVDNPKDNFYCEMKPFTQSFRPESVDVCGLSIKHLEKNGEDITVALNRFKNWIQKHQSPVFVGFPLAFDMAFVHQYFLKYLGKNPFGRTAAGIDIKTYAMTVLNIPFHNTNKRDLKNYVQWKGGHTHNALDDAKEQANLFVELRTLKEKLQR